jgi:hypothetical protein
MFMLFCYMKLIAERGKIYEAVDIERGKKFKKSFVTNVITIEVRQTVRKQSAGS